MTWTAWLTLGVAVLGAGLGLMNTYFSFSDRRTRLRVTPQWSLADRFCGMSIDVSNLSKFAVTITELGFTLGRPRGHLPRRIRIPDERIVMGRQGPIRLEPHESTSIIFHVDGLEELEITKAYAITSTGKITLGTSGALKQFIRRGNRAL